MPKSCLFVACFLFCASVSAKNPIASIDSAADAILAASRAAGDLSTRDEQAFMKVLKDRWIETTEQLRDFTAQQWEDDLLLPASIRSSLRTMGYSPRSSDDDGAALLHFPSVSNSGTIQHTSSHSRRLLMTRGNSSTTGSQSDDGELSDVSERDKNVTSFSTHKFMIKLLKGYDENQRPWVKDSEKKAVDVAVSIAVFSMAEINADDRTWECKFRILFRFRDDRLRFQTDAIAPFKYLVLFPKFKGRMWEPPYAFDNAKSVVGPSKESYYIFPQGLIRLKAHYTGIFFTPVDLSMFPFDRQFLIMEVGLNGMDDSTVVLDFDRRTSGTAMEIMSSRAGEWSVVRKQPVANFTKVRSNYGPAGRTQFFSELVFAVHVERSSVIQFMSFFLPVLACSILAHGTFYLDPRGGLRCKICSTLIVCVYYLFWEMVLGNHMYVAPTFMSIYLSVLLSAILLVVIEWMIVSIGSRSGAWYEDMIATVRSENLGTDAPQNVKERVRRRSITFEETGVSTRRQRSFIVFDIIARKAYPGFLIVFNFICGAYWLTYSKQLEDVLKGR